MDHVLDWLEREENSFCNISDTFVEVAFLLQKCVAVISSSGKNIFNNPAKLSIICPIIKLSRIA